MWKGVAILVVALLGCVSAERLLGRSDSIPADKCATSAITCEDERLYIFSLSEDSIIWYKFQQTKDGWSTWHPLANKVKMSSGPRAVKYENGTLQVFARGTDRKYHYTTLSGLNEWSDWTSPFGDMTFASPPVPVVSASGECYLFGVSVATSSVWYSVSTPLSSGSFKFSEFANLGGESTSPPAVLVDAEAFMHVFIRGSNRALWHIQEKISGMNKVWGEWECLGGVLASSPKVPVTLNGVNLVEVYVRAADKALWHRAQATSQNSETIDWTEWNSLGGVLASGPSVGLTDDGLTEVFARATDKAIYFKSQAQDEAGEIHFTQWHTLGGMFTSTPTLVVRADGLFDVFVRGVDKSIWHAHQVETNGTRSFTSWHSLGGHTRKYTC